MSEVNWGAEETLAEDLTSLFYQKEPQRRFNSVLW